MDDNLTLTRLLCYFKIDIALIAFNNHGEYVETCYFAAKRPGGMNKVFFTFFIFYFVRFCARDFVRPFCL